MVSLLLVIWSIRRHRCAVSFSNRFDLQHRNSGQCHRSDDFRLRNIGVLNDRTHRKMVVVDGREAFVGGHCIVDAWLGNAEDGRHTADVSVRLRGPIVQSVQSAFSKNSTGETCELLVGEGVFPRLEPQGDVLIHAAFAKPEGSAPSVKILHHTAICLARRRNWIQNPYFIPEPDTIDAFV